MGKTIIYTLKGAAAGAAGAVCLFVIGFVIEFFNFGWAILTCDCDKEMVFDWSGTLGLFLICVIGGAVLGLFYGMYKAKQERDIEAARIKAANSEEARIQRVKWAGEIKQKALSVNNICTSKRAAIQPLVSTKYQLENQATEIMNELTKVAEKQGQVNIIVEEISEEMQNGGGLA